MRIGTRWLLGCALAIGGCASHDQAQPPEPTSRQSAAPTSQKAAPSEAMVQWMGDVCANDAALEKNRQRSRTLVTRAAQSPGPTFEYETMSHLRFMVEFVDRHAESYEGLPRLGLRETDDFAAVMAGQMRNIQPKIRELGAEPGVNDLPLAMRVERARQIGALLDSVRSPDLAALLATIPQLAEARTLASRCGPPVPPTR